MRAVWVNRVDDKFDVKVTTDKDDYVGTLTVSLNEEVLFTKEVRVSFGAQFGPDGFDVQDWMNISIEFIDKYIADVVSKL